MKAFQAQQQRFEIKYLVDERTASAIRGMLSEYLSLDDYCRDKPGLSYVNHSIYLDTPRWQYYVDSIEENPHRYKLRARFYDDASSKPAYIEIKRRSGDLITKRRAALPIEKTRAILQGEGPTTGWLSDECQGQARTIWDFQELMARDKSAPRLHMAYYREAWVDAAEPSNRFTFDRAICCEHYEKCDLPLDFKDPIRPWGERVIATLKFYRRLPDWFWHFQYRFKLQPSNPAKYATSISMLEQRRHLAFLDPGVHPMIHGHLLRPG